MARDFYHNAVKHALEKQGWVISKDPFSFSVGEVDFQIDLSAERENMIAAQKGEEKIAVEIKTFARSSPVNAFHEALGQYENYLMALEEYEPDRILFLAIPIEIFNTFFQRPFIQKVITRKKIKIIIYDPSVETIESWIK
jgi:hypothetical protein